MICDFMRTDCGENVKHDIAVKVFIICTRKAGVGAHQVEEIGFLKLLSSNHEQDIDAFGLRLEEALDGQN
jgi:hypothetical protein